MNIEVGNNRAISLVIGSGGLLKVLLSFVWLLSLPVPSATRLVEAAFSLVKALLLPAQALRHRRHA